MKNVSYKLIFVFHIDVSKYCLFGKRYNWSKYNNILCFKIFFYSEILCFIKLLHWLLSCDFVLSQKLMI